MSKKCFFSFLMFGVFLGVLVMVDVWLKYNHIRSIVHVPSHIIQYIKGGSDVTNVVFQGGVYNTDYKTSILQCSPIFDKHSGKPVVQLVGTFYSDLTNYSVISSTSSTNMPGLNYIFDLPMTALAWKRIGFGTIILISGSHQDWKRNATLALVLNRIQELDCICIFVTPPEPHNNIMLSQTGRLFMSYLLEESCVKNNKYSPEDAKKARKYFEKIYIMTSDSDLWPLSLNNYIMPTNKHIVSLFSNCCGSFKHKGQTYVMLPLSNIGMYTSTWKEVMNATFSSGHVTPYEIISYFGRELGQKLAKGHIHKGGNAGWYMDQNMISIRIKQYLNKNGEDKIHKVPRDTHLDRADRAWSWPHGELRHKSLAGLNDSHVLTHMYVQHTWNKMLPLLQMMYNASSAEFKWSQNYTKSFQKLRFG